MESAETISQPVNAPAAELVETQPVLEHLQTQRLVAALASAVIPGAGQWLLRCPGQAIGFNAALLGMLLCYWPARLPSTLPGALLVIVSGWVLFSLATWSALRMRGSSAPAKSVIWLAVFIPIALIWSSVLSNRAVALAGFQTYSIPSQSMEHTLDIGDRLVADGRYYREHVIKRGDLVVFMKDGKHLVKRVIATGGGEVQGVGGAIYVSGERVIEPYVVRQGTPVPAMETFGPVTVPPGMLFVMGDNRNWSFDSRSAEFGLVPESDVVARPLYLYYSEHAERTGCKVE
jgi:signal peptidase I